MGAAGAAEEYGLYFYQKPLFCLASRLHFTGCFFSWLRAALSRHQLPADYLTFWCCVAVAWRSDMALIAAAFCLELVTLPLSAGAHDFGIAFHMLATHGGCGKTQRPCGWRLPAAVACLVAASPFCLGGRAGGADGETGGRRAGRCLPF